MAKKRKSWKVPQAQRAGGGQAAGSRPGKAIPVTSVARFDEYVAGDKPLVVDFWATWCGPCRVMAPIFEKVAGEFEGRVHFLKVDTERVPALAEAFGIRSIPTLVVLDGGEVVDSNIGVTDEGRLAAMAQRALDRRNRVGLMTRVKRMFSKDERGAEGAGAS